MVQGAKAGPRLWVKRKCKCEAANFKCSETRIRARNRTNMAQHKHAISQRILAHRSDEQKAILRKSRPVMFVMLAFFFGLPPSAVLSCSCVAAQDVDITTLQA